VASKPIVVVGAGVGGLAVALRLAHRGQPVVVLEKASFVGGRAHEVCVNGSRFDGGPTLLMMLDPFRKLFADVGERLEDHLDLTLCEPSYRVFFADGSKIEATSNPVEMERRIEALSGPEEATRFPKLLKRLEGLYEAAIPNFVERNFRSPLDLAAPKAIRLVMKHGMLRNFSGQIASTFRDPRLRMLFSFQTLYLGLSPFEARWVYSTLTHMEYGQGVWYPRGGLSRIPAVLTDLARQRGAEIRLGSSVAEIGERGVKLESGETIDASAVVCNADLPYAEAELVKLPPKRRTLSCSAYMLYIDYEGSLPELRHHNVFFGPDFKGNLDAVFKRLEIPADPAFYACVSARSDPGRAEPGHENLYVLVPCPNLGHAWSLEDGERLQSSVFDRLQREVGFDRRKIAGMRVRTPLDWRSEFNLDQGAAFGLSHHFLQSACFRPRNDPKNPHNLVFVGASTVPGNGLPMVVISADLAVQRLEEKGLVPGVQSGA
jgi:phytoene desaturase